MEKFLFQNASIKIIDLAKSLKSNINLKVIGKRPGEKIYETLCPLESSGDTIEFKKYFIIKPSMILAKD